MGWDGPLPVLPWMAWPAGSGPAKRPAAQQGGRSIEGPKGATRARLPWRERSAGRRRGGGVACEAATPETAGAERAEGDPRPMGREQGQRPELDGASPRGGACGTWRAPCRTAEGAGPVRGGAEPRPRYQTRAGRPRGAKAGCRPGWLWRGQGCRRFFGRRPLPAGSGKAEPWERSDQGAANQGRRTATPPEGGRGGNQIFRP